VSAILQGSIEDRVRKILAEQFCIEPSEIDLSADIGDKYGADSLAQLELVMDIEDEFEIEVPDEDMLAMKTGQQIVDYVTAKVRP